MSRAVLKRKRWSERDAREAIAALEESGQPVSVFAARHGLDAQRLYLWRRRLRQPGRPAFIEVKSAAGRCIEVELQSGRVLRVPERFDAESLRELLEVLES
ncbi:MAG: IS66 family insertion sequence element accessory protein TnpA [Solirubrobacteraceae bacterium]